MNEASVLIDLYALRPDEVRTLARALNLLKQVSLGELNQIAPFVDRLISHGASDEQREEINLLLSKLDRVLWKGRKRWTLFDRRKASIHGVLAHGLECRLLHDEEGLRKVNQHLRGVLQYHPFYSRSANEHTDQEEAQKED